MDRTTVSCPYFRQVHTHGTCRAYPDGLMNPSVNETKTLCLHHLHINCVYYQSRQNEEGNPEPAISSIYPYNHS